MMRGAGIGKVRQVENVADALEHAKAEAGPGDLILGTGSLFVAAEVREAVLGIEPELYPDLLPQDLR
jgi:folylpolyglutamate synthase/dihydropteroate synthase